MSRGRFGFSMRIPGTPVRASYHNVGGTWLVWVGLAIAAAKVLGAF